jgi:hypothetical protein
MPRKLKVFRTATGFHDAYVAAPSRKAALAAWGSDKDLFARGVAEEVTDPKLTQAPLESPGEVIHLSRGDLASQLKALGPKKQGKGKAKAGIASERKPARVSKPKPPPKREKVDAAEAALEAARRRHAQEAKTLEDQRDAIERKLDALRARQDKDIAKLERTRDAARERYRSALEEWGG